MCTKQIFRCPLVYRTVFQSGLLLSSCSKGSRSIDRHKLAPGVFHASAARGLFVLGGYAVRPRRPPLRLRFGLTAALGNMHRETPIKARGPPNGNPENRLLVVLVSPTRSRIQFQGRALGPVGAKQIPPGERATARGAGGFKCARELQLVLKYNLAARRELTKTPVGFQSNF